MVKTTSVLFDEEKYRELARVRRERLAPLFAFIASHGVVEGWVADRLDEQRSEGMSRQRLRNIKMGRSKTPRRLVEDVCAVLGVDPLEVMGAGWTPDAIGVGGGVRAEAAAERMAG